MANIVNPKAMSPLSTRFGTWKPGEPVRGKVPAATLAKWLKQGIVITNNDEPDTAELPEEDILTPLNRTQLLRTIGMNNLREQIQPMKSWSDDAIRQAIRDITPNLSDLKLPADEAESV